MSDDTASLLISTMAGAIGGLLSGLLVYAVVGLPRVRVKIRHRGSKTGSGEMEQWSKIVVANLRGRPITIDSVSLFEGWGIVNDPAWDPLLPRLLREGEHLELPLNRQAAPQKRLVGVAVDNVGRFWPRRRRLSVRIRDVRTSGFRIAFGTGRHWPTEKQMTRMIANLEKRMNSPRK